MLVRPTVIRVLGSLFFFVTSAMPAHAIMIDSYAGSYTVDSDSYDDRLFTDRTRTVITEEGSAIFSSGHARLVSSDSLGYESFSIDIATQVAGSVDGTDAGLSDAFFIDFVSPLPATSTLFLNFQLDVFDINGSSSTGLRADESVPGPGLMFSFANLIGSADLTVIEAVVLSVRGYDAVSTAFEIEIDSLRTDGSSTEHGGGSVPEPSTLILFGAGIAGLSLFRRRSSLYCPEDRLHTTYASV